MVRRRVTAVIVVLCLLAGVGLFCQPWNDELLALGSWRPVMLATLVSVQESALIDYRTSGCSHFAHFQLRYLPRPMPRFLVTDCQPEWITDPRTGRSEFRERPKHLATVELTPEQVVRFDNLLRYYRDHHGKGGCTTVDSIRVTVLRSGREVHMEEYDDATCGSYLLADADPGDIAGSGPDGGPPLSLRAVIMAAVQAKQDGLARVRYTAPRREQTGALHPL